ncbi:ATP-binding protein [Siphonobacter aquaeclarae]|uniref:histidine kinase n=1 Tax=Siphonobacter aquaeclarae TaxID=563176 RepID=A0A1G9IIQ9_9BACT|nr:ATP-binding protein [Siphonobacter aquaeclarae]SDL25012.1 GAF domain-containing protein [Siphonobacter aquaeclarae]
MSSNQPAEIPHKWADHDRLESLLINQAEVLEMISEEVPLPEVLTHVLRWVQEQSGEGVRTSVYLPDHGMLRLTASAGLPAIPADFGVVEDENPEDGIRQALQTGEMIVSELSESEASRPEEALLVRYLGVSSRWAIPLRAKSGSTLGVLVFYHPTATMPQADDLLIIRLVSRTAVTAIERTRDLEQRQRFLRKEKIARERIRVAENMAELAASGAGMGSFVIDLATNDVIYSHGLSRILTGREAETRDRSLFVGALHPEDGKIRDQAYEECRKTGELRYEARFVWHNGSIHWIKVIGGYAYDTSGAPVHLRGIVLDITTEMLGRKEQHKLMTLIEDSADLKAMFSDTRQLTYLNQSGRKLTGWEGGPLSLDELFAEPFVTDILPELFASGRWAGPVHLKNGDIPCHADLTTIYGPTTGNLIGIGVTLRDLRAELAAQEALRQSEKSYRELSERLEQHVLQRTQDLDEKNNELIRTNRDLEQFAYIASHDLQEPLRKIQSFGSMLEDRFRDRLGEEGRELLGKMQNAAGRMRTLIREILAYSRISKARDHFTRVNLNDVVGGVLDDLDGRTDAEIHIDTLPELEADPFQMVQLFQNLLSNALKFRQPGRAPVVSVTCDTVSGEETGMRPGMYYRISVRDNGIGFEEAYRNRIFEVFQRLNPSYPGTGIGLAICAKIAQNMNGAITADSVPGAGAVFTVLLPV